MSINTKCQVFTPEKIVRDLLDAVGYKTNLYGKKVAENSCGDGNILVEIVERYIVDCLALNFKPQVIKSGLERDIFGVEIDNLHIVNCIKKLDEIAEKYALINVKWNIIEGDFLKLNIFNQFDYVIGNPPYITYKELDIPNRKFVQTNFDTCKKGKFDYYYAFIEASIKSLNNTGKLAYIVPSNMFKNQFGENLRNFILPSLIKIYDYTYQKLFSKKLTSSSIIICQTSNNANTVQYCDVSLGKTIFIDKRLLNEKWVFKNEKMLSRVDKQIRFGDYFDAANSIATLLNNAFIISNYRDTKYFLELKNHKIEKTVTKPAASPRSLSQKKEEFIIFPYYYKENKICRYNVNDFHSSFPCTVEYLKQFEEKLSARQSDAGIHWFEYGRSQALAHMNQAKLMMSTLITKQVKIYHLDKNIIPTSGIYITMKDKTPDSKFDLTIAEQILQSSYFFDYVKGIGIISNGNSYRISAVDINNFTFPASFIKHCEKKR